MRSFASPDKRGELYAKVPSRQKPRGKDTQVIPWLVADAHWTRDTYAESIAVLLLKLYILYIFNIA